MKNISRVLWHTVDKQEMPKLQFRVLWNEVKRCWHAEVSDRSTFAIFKFGTGGTVSLAIKDLDNQLKDIAHG